MVQTLKKPPYTVKPEHFLNTQDTCKKLNITRMTLHRWVKMGRTKPFIRAGKAVRSAWIFTQDDVERLKEYKWRREPKHDKVTNGLPKNNRRAK